MSIADFSVEDFLSSTVPSAYDGISYSEDDIENITGKNTGVSWNEQGYNGTIDYRIRQLSYSSLLTLHTCPRKFELYKKRSTHRTEETEKSNVTFAFGHVVGEAIASVIEGRAEQDIFFALFTGWHADFAASDPKLDKSIYSAVFAIQRLLSMRESGFLQEYELVYYNGKPATELSFCVNFPDGFRLRGHVDAVLRHKISGKIIVLECKTTGAASINPATYKNSAQAIGYSIVLDVIFPELSAYEVLYLIYQTKAKEYTVIPFEKTYLQRALWIRELLLDIETIQMYEREKIYPMRGENCFTFFRECEYFNTCTLSTSFLTKPCTPAEEDKLEYQINLSLVDLLDAQLRKTEVTE